MLEETFRGMPNLDVSATQTRVFAEEDIVRCNVNRMFKLAALIPYTDGSLREELKKHRVSITNGAVHLVLDFPSLGKEKDDETPQPTAEKATCREFRESLSSYIVWTVRNRMERSLTAVERMRRFKKENLYPLEKPA